MPIMRRRRARRRSIRALCVLQKYSPIRSPIMSVVGQSLRIHPASEPTFVRCWSAASTDRRNTDVKSLRWGFELQGLAWPFIELTRHFVQIGLRVRRQVGSLRKVLSQQTIGVLVGPALPRTLRIAEVNVDIGRQRKSSMIRKLLAPVPGQRLIQLTRQHFRLLDERGNNRLGVLIGYLHQHHVTGMTFDQGRDVAVPRPGQEIALPMTRHRPIFNRCRSLTDRDEILDLSPSIAIETRPLRSTNRALRPKMAKQLLLKHPAGLNK